MVARLTVIVFIIVCLQLGIFLTVLPWVRVGILDWGDNYLLAFVVEKTGLPVLRQAVASNWFRGAVTGLGVLNLLIAFWEMAHFKQSVRMIEEKEEKAKGGKSTSSRAPVGAERTDSLSDYRG